MNISLPLTGPKVVLRKPVSLVLITLISALLLAGCRNNQSSSPSSGPQLLTTLPSTWTEIDFGRGGFLSQPQYWQQVSIDGDATPEYILFFTYDSGQVGAVIYDWQTGLQPAQSNVPIVPLNQPAGTYIPYRLEPNYWPGAGSVGFLALPNTAPGSITFAQVVRTPPVAPTATPATETDAVTAAAAPMDATAIPLGAADGATTTQTTATETPAPTATATAAPTSGNNELIIFGGAEVISTVWWQNEELGYGIAQISAPYTIDSNRTIRANNGAGSVLSAVGLTRLSGPLQRNYMCAAKLFTRTVAAPLPSTQPLFQQPVAYEATELGVTFCNGPPPNPPYYPEGVVQAFVQPYNPDSGNFDPRQYNTVRQGLLAPSVADQLSTMVDLVTFTGKAGQVLPTLVDDLVTPFTVTVQSSVQFTAPASSIMTPVCAQIRPLGDTEPSRRILFALQHVGPNQQPGQNGTEGTTDQMQIAYAADVTNRAEDCQTIVGMPILIAGPPP